MLIPRRSIRTSQPQHSIAIDWSKPITRGLKVVILPSLGWQAKDLARGLGYSAFLGGVERAPVVIGSPGKAFRSNGYLYNQYISIPSWVNVTNEGSALIIRSGAGGRLWELGDSGNSDEFPYSGLVYTDAFWLGRWANGVAPPSGKQFDVPLTIAVSVKDGRQVAFWDAEKWWSNNQSGGFTLPSSLQFGATAGGPSGGTHDTYLALAWDRALSDAELKSVSENPWQVFEDEEDHVFVPATGGGSTLNASASGGSVASGSANLAAQIALAGVGVSVAGGSANAGASVPLSAAGIATATGSATPAATITINASGLAQAAGSAGLSASVLLAGAGAAQAAGNATLAAQLNALAAGAAQAGGSANLSGGAPGELNASGQAQAGGSAVLSVTIGLQASGQAQASGSASGSASAPGQVSASGGAAAGGAATWSVTASITAAGFVQSMGAGQLTISVNLVAMGAAVASGAANLGQPGAGLESDSKFIIRAAARNRLIKAAPRNNTINRRAA